MKITVIGLGYVGLSLSVFLGTKANVIGIDSSSEKIKSLRKGIPYFYEKDLELYLRRSMEKGLIFSQEITKESLDRDFIFITVGTPIDDKGKIDLSNIKKVVQTIAKNLKNVKTCPSVIVKSTVIPGTTLDVIKPILEKNDLKEKVHFDLLTNPEFLKEGSAIQDTVYPHVTVIGGSSSNAIKKLARFYASVYPKDHKIIQTNNVTAEAIKYAANSFLAARISLINSLANICQRLPGTNVDKVAEVIGMDPRIGTQFLNAGPGYGGSCFPKDLQALISFANSIGYDPVLLDAIKSTNSDQVFAVMNLIKTGLDRIYGKRITILGLSFKENTDDIRESVSIKLIRLLLKQKCKIVVHDPKAIENARNIFGDKISYHETAKDALKDSECAVVMTPWEEYKKLTKKDFQIMRHPLIIDTRRIVRVNDEKINYIGLGVGT